MVKGEGKIDDSLLGFMSDVSNVHTYTYLHIFIINLEHGIRMHFWIRRLPGGVLYPIHNKCCDIF